jgi:hypothetical protein
MIQFLICTMTHRKHFRRTTVEGMATHAAYCKKCERAWSAYKPILNVQKKSQLKYTFTGHAPRRMEILY